MICRCGCGGKAAWLMTGNDIGGHRFTDEPACDSAAAYCQEAAAELGHYFEMKPIKEDTDESK